MVSFLWGAIDPAGSEGARDVAGRGVFQHRGGLPALAWGMGKRVGGGGGGGEGESLR